MARYTGPVCRLCRNEGQKLFLKGTRCYSDKCSVAKRPYAAGQHGQARKKVSEYGIHLREKQKLRHTYLILEKQFARYFNEAERKKGVTGTILMQLLEARLDTAVYKSGFAFSRSQARQLIRHGHFIVNGRKVDIPSYRLKSGEEVAVKAKSEKLVREIAESVDLTSAPRWITVDKQNLKFQFTALPEREELDPNVKEQLIIEYYSK